MLTDRPLRVYVCVRVAVLFRGTIRYNLDPERQLTNAQLNDALRKVHLDEKMSQLPKGIDTKNVNFSSGERQLLCLGNNATIATAAARN